MPGWGGCDACDQEFERFADTLTRVIAEDLASNPPGGAVTRVAVGWIGSDDPLAFRVHVVGIEDSDARPAGETWSPSEWTGTERESRRTNRLRVQKPLREASNALRARAAHAAGSDDADWGPSPVLVDIARRLPRALSKAAVPLAEEFGVFVVHDEDAGRVEIRRTRQLAESKSSATARDRSSWPIGATRHDALAE